MASMLVIGVAGSIIAAGNGTFALFNATTTNPNNTFSANDLIWKNTPAGGSVCTAQASVTSGATPTCSALATLTNMVPGDSKIGSLTLQNGSTVTTPNDGVTVTGTVRATSSSALNTSALSATATTGLGLLVFQCTISGADAPCSSASGAITLVPLYGSCGSNPVTATSSFATTDITAASPTGDSLTIDGQTCTGNSIIPASAFSVTGFDTVNSVSNAIANGNSVHVATVIYLPGVAGDADATLSSTLAFDWVASTVIGRSQ